MAGEWYLGPAGDQRALVCPDNGVNISDIRYGGVHQGLSGARTVDVVGIKMQIDMNIRYLAQTDYLWLEALHLRHIPGPVYLINPLKNNLLSKASSMVRDSAFPGNGAYTTGAYSWEWEASYPSGVIGTRSVRRFNLAAVSTTFSLDSANKIPVTAASTYVFSTYMKAASSKTVVFGITWYDITGAVISSSTSSKSITTSWTRENISATAPSGAVLAVPTWNSTTTTAFTSASAQFELGSSPTDWELGGGSMRVSIDQMPAQSPRYPMRNVSLSLLES